MIKWHPITEVPIEPPTDGKEKCSRPLLICRYDGTQFVGVYTLNKKNKRKSPCWEIFKRTCTRTIIPANTIAFWAELPQYSMDIYPTKYEYWDNPFLVTDGVTDMDRPHLDWTSLKETKPVTEIRPYEYGGILYNHIRTSSPVLFCTTDGQQFVGVRWQNIASSPVKEEYDILFVEDPHNHRDVLYGTAINKATVKYWTYLPAPPYEILASLSPNNYFSESNCQYFY